MRALGWLLLVVALPLAMPSDLWAQGRRSGDDDRRERHWERRDHDDDDRRFRVRERRRGDDVIVLRDRRGRVIIIDRDDFEDRFRVDRRRGRGPAFCRNGQGHPVHGRRWCLEKGFGLGVRRDVFDNRGRTIFRRGDQVIIVRDRDRGTIDRIVERILLGGD